MRQRITMLIVLIVAAAILVGSAALELPALLAAQTGEMFSRHAGCIGAKMALLAIIVVAALLGQALHARNMHHHR